MSRFADLRFMQEHRGRYDYFTGLGAWSEVVGRLEAGEALTDDELRECWRLLWLDDDELADDWRLARDHAPSFVYMLAKRLLLDRLGAPE